MKFDLINSWKAIKKNKDRINLELRISKLTILSIKGDLSNREFEIMILNIGLRITKK